LYVDTEAVEEAAIIETITCCHPTLGNLNVQPHNFT